MRERTRAMMQQVTAADTSTDSTTELHSTMQDLIRLVKQHEEIYPVMVEIVSRYCQILERDLGE